MLHKGCFSPAARYLVFIAMIPASGNFYTNLTCNRPRGQPFEGTNKGPLKPLDDHCNIVPRGALNQPPTRTKGARNEYKSQSSNDRARCVQILASDWLMRAVAANQILASDWLMHAVAANLSTNETTNYHARSTAVSLLLRDTFYRNLRRLVDYFIHINLNINLQYIICYYICYDI